MVKIAFMGVSGSGKDYIVDILKNEYGFVRFSFSDQLKKLGAKIYPWLKPDYPPEEKEKPLNLLIEETGEVITKTPREIWLSLNKLRDVENELFVRMLADEMSLVHVDNYVISDIRTQNEYDWCVDNGFQIVAIKGEAKHPKNDFDNWVRETISDGKYDYEFTNEFDGKEKIRTFIEHTFV